MKLRFSEGLEYSDYYKADYLQRKAEKAMLDKEVEELRDVVFELLDLLQISREDALSEIVADLRKA